MLEALKGRHINPIPHAMSHPYRAWLSIPYYPRAALRLPWAGMHRPAGAKTENNKKLDFLSDLSQFPKNLLDDNGTTRPPSRGRRYPALADKVLGGEWPGSSAAGEQPKFATKIAMDTGAGKQVIVKFSGKAGRPEDIRWADLLAAEHMAIKYWTMVASSPLISAGFRTIAEENAALATRYRKKFSG